MLRFLTILVVCSEGLEVSLLLQEAVVLRVLFHVLVESTDFQSTDMASVDALLLRGVGRHISGGALRVGIVLVVLIEVGLVDLQHAV